jgi:hypothetical protein
MALLFLLLVPLIIFYFLKLKRPRMEIASLALWRQVINDNRVNSPFQRFKRNLLLLLQVLLLCLLALAAMQPFLRGNVEQAEYFPVLIDCSASMGAVDAETGKSRLELAKDEVRNIIEGLLPGQKLTLIEVSSTARRLTEFTDNKTVLLNELNRMEVSEVPSRLEDGLQLAQALTRTFTIDKVWLYSDGNLPTRPSAQGEPLAIIDFDLSYDLKFVPIAGAGANIGITAFNARRGSVDAWDVFVRVEGAEAASSAAEVQLLRNGEPIGAPEVVILDKGQSQRIVFNVDSDEPARLEARLTPDGHDALAADNLAYLDLPVGRELLVYCSPDLRTYRHSLNALDGLVIDPDDAGETTLNAYDLVVSDAEDDLSREATTYLFVGVVPDELSSLLSVRTDLAEVVDWKRDAPLLQHVQLKEVQISDLPVRAEGVEDGDFEELGYELLCFGNEGPLIVRKRDGPRLYYYLLFHTDRSTLPFRVGFPILVQNAVNVALQQASLSELRAVTTGVLPPVEVQPEDAITVSDPRGSESTYAADENGILDGVAAPLVGEYEIQRGGTTVRRIGAGLLNSTETSLFGVDELQFREVPVAAESERVQADKPLWSTLALAAFIMLLIEWWYFQKRPSGMGG